ncbi:glycosyltransferase family 1 protein, partial [Chlamydiota bacterium]
MKVIFSANTSWYLYNFRLNLMRALQEKSFEIVVCAPFDDFTKKLKDCDFKFIPISLNRRTI